MKTLTRLFTLLLLNATLWAQPTIDLYTVTVPIKDRSEATRNDNFKHALIQVLTKLTGNRKTSAQAIAQAKLTHIERFVDEFKYQTLPNSEQQLLTIQFDSRAIDDLAQNLGLSLWSSTRPTLLTWIVLNNQEGQTLINEETSPAEADTLKSQAQVRGIPLLLPLSDIEDLSTLKAADLLTNAKEPLTKIAERYHVKTILVGIASMDVTSAQSTSWTTQWHLYLNGEITTQRNTSLPLKDMLADGIDRAADAIAARFSRAMSRNPLGTKSGSEIIEIKIIDVPTLKDYAQVNDYLQSLDIISNLQVLRLQPGQVTFRLSIRGGKAAFDQAVALGNILTPSTDEKGETLYRLTSQNEYKSTH
jgi:hypothetical protein